MCALGAMVPSTTASPASAASALAPGVDDDWTRGAHDLLGFVPRELRDTCRVHEPDAVPAVDDDVLDGRRGALTCHAADGAITLTYTRFASSDAAGTYLQQLVKPEPTRDMADDAGDCPTQYRIERGDDDIGLYTCFLSEGDDDLAAGAPIVTWTFEPRAIVVQAWDTDLDLARLRKVWADDAGPLSDADRRGIPPLATKASLHRANQDLLESVPAASAHECKLVDSLTPDALGSAFRWRLWILADVEECRPERGSTDTEYFRFASTGSMDDYFDAIGKTTVDHTRVAVGDSSCPGAGSYRREGERAGRYACWFDDRDTDAQVSSSTVAHVSFTDTDARVVGNGGAPANRTKALLAWWTQDARLG
jgi:hypothetical protein